MKPIKVSAPGKLHLLGEHAVVYGKPAIITAVNKRCFVEITSRKDKKIEIVSYDLKISKVTTEKEIIAKTKNAQAKWESYIKTNDIPLLKSITSDPLDLPFIVIGETFKYLRKSLVHGFKLSIKSDIPIGAGMGSSAALAISVAGAVFLLLTKKIDKEAINEIAYLGEQKRHGLPSGGDNAACCFGGLVWYRKETPDLKIIKKVPFTFPQKLAKNFVGIHTGTLNESTGEMVSLVRNLYKEKPEFVENILLSQEKLTKELLSAIKNANNTLMIHIIRVGEKNLEGLGVVSDLAKSFIREVEKIGGAAKICGAGGKMKGSGIVLVYNSDKSAIEKLAKLCNFNYMKLSLGADGVREEQ